MVLLSTSLPSRHLRKTCSYSILVDNDVNPCRSGMMEWPWTSTTHSNSPRSFTICTEPSHGAMSFNVSCRVRDCYMAATPKGASCRRNPGSSSSRTSRAFARVHHVTNLAPQRYSDGNGVSHPIEPRNTRHVTCRLSDLLHRTVHVLAFTFTAAPRTFVQSDS